MPTSPKKRVVRSAATRRSPKKPAPRAQTQPPPAPPKPTPPRYDHTVGRRKSATAFLRYYPEGPNVFTVNGVNLIQYFPSFELQNIVNQPLAVTDNKPGGRIDVRLTGGGKHGQAESVRLALSRLLIRLDPSLHQTLRKLGLLTRDSRVKERKKYGLKRARRAPQWQKR